MASGEMLSILSTKATGHLNLSSPTIYMLKSKTAILKARCHAVLEMLGASGILEF